MSGRVAIVCQAPSRWSWPVQVFHGLIERGFDAHLVVERANLNRWAPPNGLPESRLHLCHVQRRPALRAFGPRALLASEPERLTELALARIKPRLVHFENGSIALATRAPDGAAVIASLRSEDVSIGGIEDPDHFEPLWGRADAIHVSDRALEARATKRGMPADMQCAVIAPGVELSTERTPTGGSLRLLSIDPMTWTQGLEHSIQAVSLVPDCEYRISGDGEHLPALAFARHQVGVTGSVTFEPYGDPGPLLASADVLVSAQVIDGINNSVPCALAAGVPVVMTSAGELGEDALPEDVALVVRRRDPQAMAERLRELATDPQRRAQMSQAARELARERFDPQRELDQLAELYAHALT